jgi:hypothetical protein
VPPVEYKRRRKKMKRESFVRETQTHA